jgi:hypothetical protein
MLIAVNRPLKYHLWLNSKQRHTFDEFAVFVSAVGSLACGQSLGPLINDKAGGA